MCHSLAAIFFFDCTYIRTDETDETASGGGFDSFKNWFRFQQNKWENQFRFLKSFTQQMDSFQNQVRTETGFDITKTLNVWKDNWTWSFHNMSIDNLIRPQGHVTPKWLIRSGLNSNSSEILCMSSLPASIKRIGSKTTEKSWRHRFPPLCQWALSVAMETRVLIQSVLKPYATFPPPWWCFI